VLICMSVDLIMQYCDGSSVALTGNQRICFSTFRHRASTSYTLQLLSSPPSVIVVIVTIFVVMRELPSVARHSDRIAPGTVSLLYRCCQWAAGRCGPINRAILKLPLMGVYRNT